MAKRWIGESPLVLPQGNIIPPPWPWDAHQLHPLYRQLTSGMRVLTVPGWHSASNGDFRNLVNGVRCEGTTDPVLDVLEAGRSLHFDSTTMTIRWASEDWANHASGPGKVYGAFPQINDGESLSMGVLMRMETGMSQDGIWSMGYYSSTGPAIYMYTPSSDYQMRVFCTGADGSGYTGAQLTFSAGDWVWWVYVFRGTYVGELWANGRLDQNNTTDVINSLFGSAGTYPTRLAMGGRPNDATSMTPNACGVAMAAMWNRALSPEEVRLNPLGLLTPYSHRGPIVSAGLDFQMESFRFYEDDGYELGTPYPTALANEDTNASEAANTGVRIRTQIQAPEAGQYQLEVDYVGGSNWMKVI